MNVISKQHERACSLEDLEAMIDRECEVEDLTPCIKEIDEL